MDLENQKEDGILGNMLVIGISFVVIAAVVLVVVSGIDTHLLVDDQVQPTTNTGIHIGLDTVCGKTDHQGLCQATLRPVGNHSDVVTYFTAAIKATILAMKNVADNKPKGDGCSGYINLGIGQLESVLAVRSEDLFGIKSADVRNSLNSMISYQQKCLHQLPSAKFRSRLNQALQKAVELARNARDIVNEYSVKAERADISYKHRTIFLHS